jgi:hypothetical protein
VEYTNFARPVGDNAAFTIGKLRGLGDKHFRHLLWFLPGTVEKFSVEKYGTEPCARATKRLRENPRQA